MTEAQGFEWSKSRTGFPWHYDSLSFRYIRPQDSAYSIWIPLDKVDVERGGGSMAMYPKTFCLQKPIGAQFTDIANGEEIRNSRHCGVII